MKIYKKWQDSTNWMFGIIKNIIILDYFFERILKKYWLKPQFVLGGSCNKCGKCCEQIGVYMPRLHKNRFVLGLVVSFIKKTNNFEYSGYYEDGKMLIFTCNNFDKESKLCKTYKKRPAICRNYPLVRYFDKPVLFDTCGFSVSLRDRRADD